MCNILKNNDFKYSIGTSARSDFLQLNQDQTQDVDYLDITHALTKPKGQEWVMSQDKRNTMKYLLDKKKNISPGPGTYRPELNKESKQNQGVSYQFGLKLPQKQPDNTTFPAPNTYYSNKNSEKQLHYGLRDRYEETNNFLTHNINLKSPGPTKYNPNHDSVKKIANNCLRRTSPKKNDWKKGTIHDNSNPGVGHYFKTEKILYNKKSRSNSQNNSQQQSSQNDTENNHQQQLEQNHANLKDQYEDYSTNNFVIDIKKQQSIEETEEAQTKLRNNLQQTFPKSERFKEKTKNQQSTNPNIGPGAYNIPVQVPSFKNGKSISPLKKNIEQKQKTEPPGPAQYYHEKNMVHTMPKAPQYKIGKASRSQSPGTNSKVMAQVAPGKYNLNFSDKRNIPEVKIGTSQRFDFTKSQGTVGPGDYKIPSKAIEGHEFKILGKSKNDIIINRQRKENPSPNQYAPNYDKVQSKSPQYRVGNSKRAPLCETQETPAPNYYKYNPKTNQDYSPKFTFSKAKRFQKQQDNDLPFIIFQ